MPVRFNAVALLVVLALLIGWTFVVGVPGFQVSQIVMRKYAPLRFNASVTGSVSITDVTRSDQPAVLSADIDGRVIRTLRPDERENLPGMIVSVTLWPGPVGDPLTDPHLLVEVDSVNDRYVVFEVDDDKREIGSGTATQMDEVALSEMFNRLNIVIDNKNRRRNALRMMASVFKSIVEYEQTSRPQRLNWYYGSGGGSSSGGTSNRVWSTKRSLSYSSSARPPRWVTNSRNVILLTAWLAGIALIIWLLRRGRRAA